MATIGFDSHALIKRLRSAGFTEEQAEAVADASRDAIAQLVTREGLEGQLKALEHRLTIKLGGLVTVGVGLILAAMRLPA